MRKLVTTLALAGVLALSAASRPASAGPGEMPGVEPTPTPEELGAQTQSAAALPPFVVVFVNGVPVVIWLT